jgi:hypothetical protein
MWHELGHQSHPLAWLTRVAIVGGLLLAGVGLGALTVVVNPMYLLIGALGAALLLAVALRPSSRIVRAALLFILCVRLCLVYPRSEPPLRGRRGHRYRSFRWQVAAWKRGH